MKIVLSLLSLLSLSGNVANAYSNADKFYHERPAIGPSMWLFGTEGVYIYNPDGSKQLKHLKNTDICENVYSSRSEKYSQDCGFKTVVSDGHKYVWASNTQGSGRVEAFDIDTGDHVASNPTCNFPWDIDYHPSREEVWVQCWSPDAAKGDMGHIDTFNVNAITADAQQINLQGTGELAGGHGTIIVDSSLGKYGYGTVLSTNILYKINLDTKMVEKEIELEKSGGLFRMQYSPQNKHLYIRSYVCCTCGVNGSESDYGSDCRDPSKLVSIKTGPSAGQELPGLCGHSCEGTAADTVGIYEYDTVTDEVVTTWNTPDGLNGNPVAAPDGSFIALLANDGGDYVRIITPNGNGEESTLADDVQLGFSNEDGEVGISNIEVIKDSNHNIAIFTSTLANFIVLMNLDDWSIAKLELTTADEISSNHGRGAKRSIAWAVGTNYVWVDANAVSDQYVIELHASGDITKAKVLRTLSDIPSRTMTFVKNYKASDTVLTTKIEREVEDDAKSTNSTSIAGLAIACVALVLGVASMFMARKK